MSKVAAQLERALRNGVNVEFNSLLGQGLVRMLKEQVGLPYIERRVVLPISDHFTDEKLGNYLQLLLDDIDKELLVNYKKKRESKGNS